MTEKITYHYKKSGQYHAALCGKQTHVYKTTAKNVRCLECIDLLIELKRQEIELLTVNKLNIQAAERHRKDWINARVGGQAPAQTEHESGAQQIR